MSNKTKQTAVDIFIERLRYLGYLNNENYDTPQVFQEIIKAKEMEKQEMIDFASWLAKSEWMSIWVVDKWMWECQKENSNTNYKTDKELFDIYYEQTYGGNK
jgi:hypothetical protein